MTSEPTKVARRDQAADEESRGGPHSAGPHAPGAEDNGQAATTSAAATASSIKKKFLRSTIPMRS